MPTVISLIRACHPEACAAVTVGATLLAVGTGRDAPGCAAVAAAVLAGQLSVGWSNDWLDAARDRAAGRSDKPVARGVLPAATVRNAALLSAFAVVPLSLLSGWRAAAAHLVAVAAAWLYNWPLKATVASVLPYLVGFGLLPAFVVLGLPGTPAPPVWLVAAGAALGAGAHFANVVEDIDDDARSGIHGLPHRLGRTGSLLAASLLLLAATALLAFGPPGRPPWYAVGALVAAAVLVPAGAVLGLAFRVVMIVGLLDVVLLVASGTRVR